MTSAVLIGVGLLVYSRSGSSLCGRRELRASAVPVPAGFEVLSNVSVEPEGCGADYKRYAVMAARGSGEAATERYGNALVRDGWRPTACVTTRERCFRTDGWFAALIPATPDDTKPSGYPQTDDPRARTLVVVQPE